MAGPSRARWFFGVLLIAVGVVFLLDTTGVVALGDIPATYWPLLLVGWGIWALVRGRGRSLPGLLVLLLGMAFQAERLDLLEPGWPGRYWPAILIVVGLALLLEALLPDGRRRRGHARSEDRVDAVAILSGRKEQVRSSAWRGGRITAIMGGVEVDLLDATPVADGAILDVTAVMGGVDLRVPEGWRITITGTPLLGGFDDKTRGGSVDGPSLEIRGAAIMGGVDIKN
jgi:hypothetical protein